MVSDGVMNLWRSSWRASKMFTRLDAELRLAVAVTNEQHLPRERARLGVVRHTVCRGMYLINEFALRSPGSTDRMPSPG